MAIPKNETTRKLGLMLALALELGMVLALGFGLGVGLELVLGRRLGLLLGLGLALVLALVLGMVLGLELLLGLVLGQVGGLNRLFSKRSPSTTKLERLYFFFPEEQANDVTTKLRWLKKAKKPQWFIRLKATQYWLELFWAAIQIRWDNLWQAKKNINK